MNQNKKDHFIPSDLKKEEIPQPKTKEDVMSLYAEVEVSFKETSASITGLTSTKYREDVDRVSRSIQILTDKVHAGLDSTEVEKSYKTLLEIKDKLRVLKAVIKMDSNRNHI